jgi:hypothetical protein
MGIMKHLQHASEMAATLGTYVCNIWKPDGTCHGRHQEFFQQPTLGKPWRSAAYGRPRHQRAPLPGCSSPGARRSQPLVTDVLHPIRRELGTWPPASSTWDVASSAPRRREHLAAVASSPRPTWERWSLLVGAARTAKQVSSPSRAELSTVGTTKQASISFGGALDSRCLHLWLQQKEDREGENGGWREWLVEDERDKDVGSKRYRWEEWGVWFFAFPKK